MDEEILGMNAEDMTEDIPTENSTGITDESESADMTEDSAEISVDDNIPTEDGTEIPDEKVDAVDSENPSEEDEEYSPIPFFLLNGGKDDLVNDSADEVPADEVPADEVPADEVPADEVPADEVPADEVPADKSEQVPQPERDDDLKDDFPDDETAERDEVDHALPREVKSFRDTKLGKAISNITAIIDSAKEKGKSFKGAIIEKFKKDDVLTGDEVYGQLRADQKARVDAYTTLYMNRIDESFYGQLSERAIRGAFAIALTSVTHEKETFSEKDIEQLNKSLNEAIRREKAKEILGKDSSIDAVTIKSEPISRKDLEVLRKAVSYCEREGTWIALQETLQSQGLSCEKVDSFVEAAKEITDKQDALNNAQIDFARERYALNRLSGYSDDGKLESTPTPEYKEFSELMQEFYDKYEFLPSSKMIEGTDDILRREKTEVKELLDKIKDTDYYKAQAAFNKAGSLRDYMEGELTEAKEAYNKLIDPQDNSQTEAQLKSNSASVLRHGTETVHIGEANAQAHSQVEVVKRGNTYRRK